METKNNRGYHLKPHRNIAFWITSNERNTRFFLSAEAHFKKISEQHGYQVYTYKNKFLKIYITYEHKVIFSQLTDGIEFPIGNLGDNPIQYDRFLKIKVNQEHIEIENDYAGAIPVFYSNRNYLSLSNIEPCVSLDSGASVDDISFENLYGFMRYMHFIWDETIYRHVFTMLPDSKHDLNAITLKSNSSYLKTVYCSNDNVNLNNNQVASKLNNLNDELVYRSLGQYDKIILPLSSGYDSRMILSSLSKHKKLKEKLHCFTYGSVGSIEVEAARRLTHRSAINWDFIDLPLNFLTKPYLEDIHDVFGSSLHMHGMYQFEFYNEIKRIMPAVDNQCLTSGFMTGVPAGAHNSFFSIKNNTETLTGIMNKLCQSQYWLDEDLLKMDAFKENQFIEQAEERFRLAFNRFDGETHQKSVMFDVWTRQRNFISYYPRTLEWQLPTVSPHMCPDYANFFMSLSKEHLDDRYAVELMFSNHYPELSKVISNSNGIKSISSPVETGIFLLSRIFKRLGVSFLMPNTYANNAFEFDLSSLRKSKEKGVYPFLNTNPQADIFMRKLLSKETCVNLYQEAYNGDIDAYQKIITLQSVLFSILKMND